MPSGQRALSAAWVALMVALASPASADGGTAPPRITCRLSVPAQGQSGQPVPLRMQLANPGSAPVQVLTWNTPFEGDWFGPFVEVSRNGQPLPYQGPMLKRGDPAADEYLTLPARASRQAELDLARAFDLGQPGHYRVVTVGRLADVWQGEAATLRTRASFQAQALECPPVEFRLR